jgi:ABC-2 type transport system ATP-binding protein
MVSWTTSRLKSFVEYSLSKGSAIEEVKLGLLKAGWSNAVVAKIFTEKSLKKMGQPSVIKADAVSKSFGRLKILDSVSFDVKPQEIFGIIGLSGSGKTTLLNLVVGFIEPDAGDVSLRFGDRFYSVYKKPEMVKRAVGFAAQEASFYSKLTVAENISYFASLYGLAPDEARKRCSALIRLIGLAGYENKQAGELSGGMRKRLDIACSLVHNPEILILDEPTADLDPIACEELWQLVRQIKDQGKTVIIASHFLDELEAVCDRVAVLHEKRIVDIGSPDELRNMYSKNYELHFKLESGNYKAVLDELSEHADLEISKIVKKDGAATVCTLHPQKALEYLSAIIEKSKEVLIDANISKPSLKEYFESLVRK